MMHELSQILYRPAFALLLALCTCVPTATSQQSPAEIRRMLERRDAEIKAILGDREEFTEKQRDELKDVINGIIDFEAMGRSALGQHWETLSAKEKSDFVDVFSAVVRAQSLSNLDVYRARVAYEEVSLEGDVATVVTQTTYKDVPARVVYRMVLKNEAWRVTDIVLDDVSTAEGYARSFQSVIRKKGFGALMASLEKRRDKEEERG